MVKVVPFYGNRDDDMSCALACYRMTLEYFTGKQYSWEELEKISGFQPDRAAWTVKIWSYLAAHGFDIRMIEAFDYQRYAAEGESYLKSFLKPEEIDWQLKHSNLLEIKPELPKFLETVHQEHRSPTLKDIGDMLAEGYLVLAHVNSRKLNEKPGYSSHVVLVTAGDGDDVIVHDPGLPPRPNRRVSKQLLWKAMGGAESTSELTGIKLKT